MINQQTFEQFVFALHDLGDNEAVSTYADNYIGVHSGSFPIIEGNTAHFVYRIPDNADKDAIKIGIDAEWNGHSPREAIMNLIGGGLLHYQHDFEPDARLDYLFADITGGEGHTLLDPLNTRIGKSGFGDKSELAMPAYIRSAVTMHQENVASGRLVQSDVKSKALRQQRAYTVYLPYDYNEQDAEYPTLYFNDGNDYVTMGEATTILDNLIASKALPPVVAVFVSPVEREREYNCSDVFTSFFCDELVPEMHQRYHLDVRPEQRCVIGASMGGLISLYMASQRPDIFRLLCAQSTVVKTINGLEKYDARTSLAVSRRLPLRLALAIGSYENCFARDAQGQCRDLLTSVHELRHVLDKHGYPYHYREAHQSHSWGLWRDTLADALVYLFKEQDVA